MSNLISREAAIEAIEKNAYKHIYFAQISDQIIDIISESPSVQPEIVRILKGEQMKDKFNCPNCGAPIISTKCPYCGSTFYDFVTLDSAKM